LPVAHCEGRERSQVERESASGVWLIFIIHYPDAVRFAELDRDEFSARSLALDLSDSHASDSVRMRRKEYEYTQVVRASQDEQGGDKKDAAKSLDDATCEA